MNSSQKRIHRTMLILAVLVVLGTGMLIAAILLLFKFVYLGIVNRAAEAWVL